MSRSKNLYQLQQIDSEIDRSLDRINEIDSLLADDSTLQEAERKEADQRKKLKEQGRKLKAAEDQVEDQEYKIERNKKKLYGGTVTNPKELEDLQMEAEALGDYLSVLEDRQLEEMLAYEEAQDTHQSANNNLQNIQHDWDQKSRQWRDEKSDLKKKIDRLNEQRKDHIREIPEEDLNMYERLRKSSGGVAAAALEASSCTACGSQVPSGLAQQAASPSQLAQCSTCGRILHAS
jgi:hypothetical protein